MICAFCGLFLMQNWQLHTVEIFLKRYVMLFFFFFFVVDNMLFRRQDHYALLWAIFHSFCPQCFPLTRCGTEGLALQINPVGEKHFIKELSTSFAIKKKKSSFFFFFFTWSLLKVRCWHIGIVLYLYTSFHSPWALYPPPWPFSPYSGPQLFFGQQCK